MKTAILLVAYGSANPGGRAGLDNFERLCRLRFPVFPLRWAYSSAVLRSRLAKGRKKSDSVSKAIMRLYFENFKAVAIQPLQTICGREYEQLVESALDSANKAGIKCSIGMPLLGGMESSANVAQALIASLPEERSKDEDIIFMGHGARHRASSSYISLNEEISKMDSRIHIGSMSGPILLDNILPKLSSKRVWLIPLLSVIGRHALYDMAGSHPESWKTRLESQGHECVTVLRGMAQCESISNLWLNNLASIL